MYLPQLLSGRPYWYSVVGGLAAESDPVVGHHNDECETSRYACSLLTRLISSIKAATWEVTAAPILSRPQSDLRRRDDLQTQNITIGVVVGLFLTIFLVALFYFLHRYSASIRVRKKKRRSRRRGSRAGSGTSSKGSASSTSTQGSAAPPEPPATA
ncbi:hypothetical protein V8F06_004254 [Rhypophila decipiens]